MSTLRNAKLLTLDEEGKHCISTLTFQIECIHTKKTHKYSLVEQGQRSTILASALAWYLYRRKNSIGHSSREAAIFAMNRFLDFLEENLLDYKQCENLNFITADTLHEFGAWLKQRQSLQYSTAAKLYTNFTRIFPYLRDFPSSPLNISIPNYAFPKGAKMSVPVIGYTPEVYKKIFDAVSSALRTQKKEFEFIYKKKWGDKPPPLEDVAPVWMNVIEIPKPLWCHEMRIWWWENKLGCAVLNAKELCRVSDGERFVRNLNNVSGQENSKVFFRKQQDRQLEEFYESIDARCMYAPKYLGLPPPIKYQLKWDKPDYLIWYWERTHNAELINDGKMRKLDKRFYTAVMKVYGSMEQFYKAAGMSPRITLTSLIPYYLMLLMRTALNPSVIQRLTTDCIIQDPFDAQKWSINWVKIRSFTNGKTIPSQLGHEEWPVMIIKRVIEITARLRQPGVTTLWLTDRQAELTRCDIVLTDKAFLYAIKQFVKIHDIRECSEGKTEATPLKLEARKFRPTIATNEYLRTEDLLYLKTLLGHSRLSQTASYVNSLGDPILRMRRGIHQKAMFLDLTGKRNSHEYLKEKLGISSNRISKILRQGGEHDATLNHCLAPTNSPVPGQKNGTLCSAEGLPCLSCSNLVITFDDLVKYFSYIFYHQDLVKNHSISESQFHSIISEKAHIWDNHILPRYGQSIQDDARRIAVNSPPAEWKIVNSKKVGG